MGQAVTFTATEANAAGVGLELRRRHLGHRPHRHRTPSRELGAPNVDVTVTGDGTNTIGTSSSGASGSRSWIRRSSTWTTGRFQVRSVLGRATDRARAASARRCTLTPDTGYFWFFNPANIEVVVKVLDACSVDGYFWVFGGGLTNLGVQMTVPDTITGVTKTYTQHGGPRPSSRSRTRVSRRAPASTAGGRGAARRGGAERDALRADAGDAGHGRLGYLHGARRRTSPASAVTYRVGLRRQPGCPSSPGCSGGADGRTESPTRTSHRRTGTYTVTVTASSGSQTAIANGSVTVTRGCHDAASLGRVHDHGRDARAARQRLDGAGQPGDHVQRPRDARAVLRTWDFGDGETAQTGATVTHTFTRGRQARR